jgi:hypothetical protein
MLADQNLEHAAKNIGIRPIFDHQGREIHVVCILAWSPPLVAAWWRGKEATIIGADVDGNFFLRHCDGSVRYWDHSKKSETIVATSVKAFTSALRHDVNDSLSWWKRKDAPADT